MKKAKAGNVLIYIEEENGVPARVSLEALSASIRAAHERGGRVIAAVLGNDAEKAAENVAHYGAEKALAVDTNELKSFNLEAYADVLGQIIETENPFAVFFGGSPDGRDLAAKIAARFGAGVVTDVLSFRIEEGGELIYTTAEYSGSILADIWLDDEPFQIAVIRSGAFKKPEAPAEGSLEITDYAVSDGAVRTVVKETVREITENVNLEDAEVIVSGGRGMGNKENFLLVKELADVLGGEVGATRPAIEEEWISKNHQVGQSGKSVSPKLYIACGISGATQHVSGITGSEYIVAINKDEDAPIFDMADVGIVGDAVKIIPAMIEEIRRIKD